MRKYLIAATLASLCLVSLAGCEQKMANDPSKNTEQPPPATASNATSPASDTATGPLLADGVNTTEEPATESQNNPSAGAGNNMTNGSTGNDMMDESGGPVGNGVGTPHNSDGNSPADGGAMPPLPENNAGNSPTTPTQDNADAVPSGDMPQDGNSMSTPGFPDESGATAAQTVEQSSLPDSTDSSVANPQMLPPASENSSSN